MSVVKETRYLIHIICLANKYGAATVWPPNQVKTTKDITNIQAKTCITHLNPLPAKVIVLLLTSTINPGIVTINKVETMAITPNPFIGILRKMAYANRKYHSGTMCSGVFSILANTKFSGSPKR